MEKNQAEIIAEDVGKAVYIVGIVFLLRPTMPPLESKSHVVAANSDEALAVAERIHKGEFPSATVTGCSIGPAVLTRG